MQGFYKEPMEQISINIITMNTRHNIIIRNMKIIYVMYPNNMVQLWSQILK